MATSSSNIHHKFSTSEINYLRKQLLSFYDAKKRDLPWRRLANSLDDINQKSYSVWVSEIMLQQTQVATVIDYYNRWIKKWPTVEALSKATLEEVNEMWSGLGYYSRGRRLYEGAQKVASKGGEMPKDSKSLLKELPGVGRYTAGAISSIAYNEVTGVVDGNVIRVLSRLRLIGSDTALPMTTDLIWELANTVVDVDRPGDFNQAMMELGATLCTPKSPDCRQCPISGLCKAYHKSKTYGKVSQQTCLTKSTREGKEGREFCLGDLEDVVDCQYCLSCHEKWDCSLGVINYPRKGKKKPPKEETYISLVIKNTDGKLMLSRRPEKGLLAGLWEFPMFLDEPDKSEKQRHVRISDYFKKSQFIALSNVSKIISLGKISHVFSHLHHVYHVFLVSCSSDQGKGSEVSREHCWLTRDAILTSGISTSVRKILKLYESSHPRQASVKRKRNEAASVKASVKGQTTLENIFAKKSLVKPTDILFQ